jgi:DNA-binding transcriptional LysR family regulator
VELRLLRYFVAVAEERHIGRAATRLHMTQPPLSRAMRQLEEDLGITLLERTPKGVRPTRAGSTLYRESLALLERADTLRERVLADSDGSNLIVGTLADTAELVGGALVEAFRRRNPHVQVRVHESDLSDPTAGLRTDLVDVALTRTPFDDSAIATQMLREDPVGIVVRDDDPLIGERSVRVSDLTDRRWVRLPEGTDALWAAYWTGPDTVGGAGGDRPVMRTIQECVQSVLWSGASALAPITQPLPPGLVVIPVRDRPTSKVIVAWKVSVTNAAVRSFIETAVQTFKQHERG